MNTTSANDPRIAIAAAARAEIARLALLEQELPNLDADVAAQALETFESAEGAASWLLNDHHASLPHCSPVELARSADGKAEVLKVLRRIEHGIL